VSINLSELRGLNFADAMYGVLFPGEREPCGQSEIAYEFLWKKIVDQQLRPGDRVIDAALASEAGMSRTPLREAIQRLVQDGLLEALPRGVRVASLTVNDTEHLYDYRTALETSSARQAATAIAQTDVRGLLAEGRSLQVRVRAPGGQHDPHVAIDFMRYDVALHQLLLHSVGNPYITRALATIHARFSVFQVAGARVPGRIERGIADHERILVALLARDGAVASDAMEAHIQRVKYRVLADFFGVPASDERGGLGDAAG